MIYIKNRSEIEKMRKAGRFAARLLNYIEQFVKEGVTTLELNDLCEDFTRKHGHTSAPLNYKGTYPKSICTSINNIVCHGIPKSADVLKKGDIINIDVSPRVDGYIGDTSRTFKIGKVSPEAEELVELTQKAMWVGIEQVKPGNRISDIGNAIEEFLAPKKYGIVRDLMGHGVGKNFHEEPQVPHFKTNRKLAKIEPGMIFTVEPMINLGTWEVIFDKKDKWTVWTKDGKISAQFEHTVLVTEKGYEILTLDE